MRYFKLSAFRRFADKADVCDAILKTLAAQLEKEPKKGGLGGMVHKLRLARDGDGASGGYRILLFFRQGERMFFAHGFAKSDRGNITSQETKALKAQAKLYMRLTEAQLDELLQQNRLTELL